MENVYNIRLQKKMNFILPTTVLNDENTSIEAGEMAIIIHLYYEDTINRYFEYISQIPEEIDIYITSVEGKTKDKVQESIQKYQIKNCTLIVKENRGRDVSSLLVACRDIILNYSYICFLHDKKGKTIYDMVDKDEWIISMWDNMIYSKEYIYNVKNVFDKNKQIGVLSVPEPFDEKINIVFGNLWGRNFEYALELKDKLHLNCMLERTVPPITLGTIFWCRTKALQKLFSFPWKYEDFPQEPMPDDQTISHGIERILAYVAQDAGYETGSIRTVECAEKQVGDMLYYLQKSFQCMEKYMGVWSVEEAIEYEERKKKCCLFAENCDEIYLYGAGHVGRECFLMMQNEGILPKAFIVTTEKAQKQEWLGVPVVGIHQVEHKENMGIIITVGYRYKDEIVEELKKRGFHNYILYE